MAPDLKKTIKIAAVQAAPVFLNRAGTTEKVCRLIREAGEKGADVIGFPEGFIPCFPSWVEILPLVSEPALSLYREFFHEAVEVPGPEVSAIQEACRDANIYAVVGINERRAGSTGTLFNTQLMFGRDGELLHKHQKYVPTIGERLIHAPGATGSKASVQTDFGCLSTLICASLSCFVINSVAVVSNEAIDAYGGDEAGRKFLHKHQEKTDRATILGPNGSIVAGPFEEAQEGILYADVSANDLVIPKYVTDYAGHYNRPELFAHHFAKYFENGQGNEATQS
ncbi:nitrilase/cyanide hydratase and apolipoprotein N-acyltransferase [Blastomyces gilchristii SLH14081]|uniref:Nitrilase/cyanide hydratase and apolipoprotein N-acyltransferase n=1 Tax=Blastomyces gilchristii (strain SLH14081) TaxID=559298 RepID=A0A179UBE3_BLAGS|nr:nitrilase/cyanide hydratase and apolipoprotein N-acyltransferase [Blastomyces gilchristii SLH14081]OAT05336.1 nitrilase/cyanide hydratase and apolipoprotein N-acyltransferase [Blastomyces gilchristii SLH14081]